MHQQNNNSAIASRILYTMVRVGDLERSINFYSNALGMRELKRETFTEGLFTLVFMGYQGSKVSIELSYNWDKDSYNHRTGYGHIALEVDDIYATSKRLENRGINATRAPGPTTYAVDENDLRENQRL